MPITFPRGCPVSGSSNDVETPFVLSQRALYRDNVTRPTYQDPRTVSDNRGMEELILWEDIQAAKKKAERQGEPADKTESTEWKEPADKTESKDKKGPADRDEGWILRASRSAGKFLLDVMSPLVIAKDYIIKPKKLIDDIKNTRRNLEEAKGGAKVVLSSLVASEIAAVAFFPIAGAGMAALGLGTSAVAGGVILADYLAAVATFQGFYLAQTWKAYKEEKKSSMKAFFSAERDLVNLHLRALGSSMVPYMLGFSAILGGEAATGSVGVGVAGSMALGLFNSLAYMSTMSVLSLDLYPKVAKLLEKQNESEKTK